MQMDGRLFLEIFFHFVVVVDIVADVRHAADKKWRNEHFFFSD